MLPRPLSLSAQVLQRAARATTAAPSTQGLLRGQHAASSNPNMQQNGAFASYNQTSSSGSSGSSSSLQHFFTSAKAAILRGGVNDSNPDTVNHLLKLMSHISLEELGLDPDMVQDPFLGALKLHLRDSRIKYMRIYEDHTLTFGLFCFPAGATIPLHNHPGMTVFSRLLFGRLRVSAFDWAVQPPEPITEGGGHRAQLVYDAVVEASSPPLVLFPASGGNLHEFTAETPCAVLDLLTPPYEPPTRNCTYYRLQRPPTAWPVARAAGGRAPAGPPMPALGEVVELEVFEPPDSFEVVSGLYPGDPVS